MLAGLRRALRRNRLTLGAVESAPARLLARTARSATAVERPVRFFLAELARRGGSTSHRLRATGLTVNLRHGSRDVAIFLEIFGANPWPNVYEPPREVDGIVRRANTPRLVDLGANIGLFALFALGRWPDSSVESFEPDPSNLPLLRRALTLNRLESRWTVREVAVSNSAGELPFLAGLHAESQLAGVGDPAARAEDAVPLSQGKEIRVPVVDLFDALEGHVELMKVDIEGAEWAILQDPRLAELDADAIVLEWHAMGCPEPDPRAAARRLLAAAGFGLMHDTGAAGPTGMLWAWRPRARARD